MEGGAKNVGVFRVKITILRQKILFFPILGGARAGCDPRPPLDPPLHRVVSRTPRHVLESNTQTFSKEFCHRTKYFFNMLILHYYFVFFCRCRRVIVILSRGFENSEYCDFALKLAQSLSPGKLLFIRRWYIITVWFKLMVFNAIFNNISVISWQSVLLVEETGVPGENHRQTASH